MAGRAGTRQGSMIVHGHRLPRQVLDFWFGARRLAGTRPHPRSLVSQGPGVRRHRSARASATRSSAALARRRTASGTPRRTARWRECCCSTSSPATSIATRHARSPATRARSAAAEDPRWRADTIARSIRFGRWFLYLPFEHAEDAAAQHRSLALFGALAQETGDDGAAATGRAKHADVIFRFGRYPHRNAILGRASTPEEVAFLAQPGSRF